MALYGFLSLGFTLKARQRYANKVRMRSDSDTSSDSKVITRRL